VEKLHSEFSGSNWSYGWLEIMGDGETAKECCVVLLRLFRMIRKRYNVLQHRMMWHGSGTMGTVNGV